MAMPSIKTPKKSSDARRRPAGRRSARLHHPSCQARRHHRRARPPLPRLHGQRAGHHPGAAELRPAGLPALPKSICTSVNHEVCHGIPGDKVLKHGDIVNIDVTVIKDGYHGDTSRMFYVGEPSIQARRLCDVTYECMWLGIAQVRPGAHLGDIGARDPDARREDTASASCANSAATASAASSTRSRRSCTTAARHARRAGGRHDLHGRADDQRRQAATSASWPTAGPSSPRTTACRRSGSTRCS